MTRLNIAELAEAANKNRAAFESTAKYFTAVISSDVESRVAEMKESDTLNLPDHSYDFVRKEICREWFKIAEKASRVLRRNKESILTEIDAAMRYRFSA